MISCVRARALSHARLRRPPLIRPLPSSWLVRWASTNDAPPKDEGNNNSSSSNSSSNSGSPDGTAAPPSESVSHPDVDPFSTAAASAAPPVDATSATVVAGGVEPWSGAQDFLADFPGSVTPLMADAGMHLLIGIIKAGGHISGAVQSGVQEIHTVTGLPWWATIAVATIGVKITLIPVVVHQARHVDRLRMAWPEIQTLRGHLASTLDEVGACAVRSAWCCEAAVAREGRRVR